MTIEDLVKLLSLGGITNWVGLAISLIALLFFLYTKLLSSIRAISYCAFLFCGFAVAHLQWMIYSGVEGDEIGWQIWATTVSVAMSSILGCLASLKFLRHDQLIQVIVVMTLLLGVLQFSYMFGGFNYRYLNVYARIYALICIISPWLVTLNIWRARKCN